MPRTWARGWTVKPRRILALALIAVLAAALAWAAGRLGGLTRVTDLEEATFDWRQRALGGELDVSADAEDEIVLVLFDEAATAESPILSPYPRRLLADLISALSQAGPRAIGLDVYLDRRLDERHPLLDSLFGGGDRRLRGAMEEAGNVVLVAPFDLERDPPALAPPEPYFAEAATAVGAAELPSAFETVREGVLLARSAEGLVPSFALAVYAEARGLDLDSLLKATERGGRLDLPGLPAGAARLPETWARGPVSAEEYTLQFPVRFHGPPSRTESEHQTFRAFSGIPQELEALALFSPEFFRDKIVLLGTGFHDSDKFRTPFYEEAAEAGGEYTEGAGGGRVDEGRATADYEGWMFGVEVHANALRNMLEGRYVRRLADGPTLLLLLLAALSAAVVVFWKGPAWGAGASVLAAGAVVLGAFSAFFGSVPLPVLGGLPAGGGLLWIPVVTPLLAVLLGYLASTAYVAVVEGREKRFIRGAFGKYVSPAVVNEISEHPEALRLGGQKRPLTVLFSDLAGFTGLSERLEPEELISLLNEYLSEMTGLVLDEEGTLDKYIGDAVMAFWNAPKAVPDHADRALRCAVHMQRTMGEINRRWKEEGRHDEPLVVRIGINTGSVVVGNVGGRERFDYSAIGDPVNLAARLEPANKTYGTLLMTSEFTLEHADASAYRLRELDLLAVKGKDRPVRVFEVVELAGAPLTAGKEEALGHYDSGLRAFRDRDWSLAVEYFAAALDADPDDGPSRVYLERAREYRSEPPPAEWDFVVRRTVK